MSDRMSNLLDETINMLIAHSVSEQDVVYVSSVRDGHHRFYNWEDFKHFAKDVNYHKGFGRQEIEKTLTVVGVDFWLERGEYDGSEWWEFKRMPVKPVIYDNVHLSSKDYYEDEDDSKVHDESWVKYTKDRLEQKVKDTKKKTRGKKI